MLRGLLKQVIVGLGVKLVRDHLSKEGVPLPTRGLEGEVLGTCGAREVVDVVTIITPQGAVTAHMGAVLHLVAMVVLLEGEGAMEAIVLTVTMVTMVTMVAHMDSMVGSVDGEGGVVVVVVVVEDAGNCEHLRANKEG
jgi:hypothetical protein